MRSRREFRLRSNWQPLVIDDDQFYGGAPTRLESSIGLVKPDDPKIRMRAILVVMIGWLPLVLLSGIEDLVRGGNSQHRLLFDFGCFARYLVAAPLLIIAESACFPKFQKIIWHFRNSGLIANSDREDFDNIVRSSSRMLRSKTAEIISFVIAYAITAYWIVFLPPNDLISWTYAPGSERTALSLAGKWHAFISLPLLMVLVLGWLWRQISWARFLWLVSHIDVQLIPTHPDRCGGLRFLSTVVHAYRPIGFACTAIVAGGIANRIVHVGATLQTYRDVMIAIVVLIAFLCVAPLVVFAPTLRRLRGKGVFEYGDLARNIGSQLEQKWLTARISRDNALEVSDFSATTDLYSVVGNVYTIAHLPVSFANLRELLIFCALPFVPVLLIAVGMKAILDAILKLAIS